MRQVIWLCALLLLSACGDPLADFTRITEVDVAPDETTAQVFPAEDEAAGENVLLSEGATPEATGAEDPLAQDTTPPQEAKPVPPRRSGFLGLFRRANPSPAPDDVADNAALASALQDANASQDATDETVELASLDAAISEKKAATPPRRGILGILSPGGVSQKPLTGSNVTDVRFRTELPYGEVARVCEARG